MRKNARTEFDEFWNLYPHRVGKIFARKAFEKARRVTSLMDILDGVERYVATKPAWQHYAHPASWLNAGRWDDEPASEQQEQQPARLDKNWLCWHKPPCFTARNCVYRYSVESRRRANL